MRSTNNHVIVKVDTVYNNKYVSQVKDENGQEIEFYTDPTFKPYEHAKTCGEVVALPDEYESEPLTAKSVDYPTYRGVPYSFYRTSDFKNVDIRIGDKIYFHYSSLRPHLEEQHSLSYVCDNGDDEFHLVRNESLFCTVRDGDINMLFGKVLVEPSKTSDTKEIDGLEYSVSKGGLIIGIGAKYDLNKGVVKHISNDDFGLCRNIEPETEVLYLKNCEFKNTIERKEYYLMKHWDIIAKKEGGGYIPVGDFVMIKYLAKERKSAILTLDTDKDERIKTAEILEIGNKCSRVKKGDIVEYNSKSSLCIEYGDVFFVRESEIIYIK